jgi:hypothetical protein
MGFSSISYDLAARCGENVDGQFGLSKGSALDDSSNMSECAKSVSQL